MRRTFRKLDRSQPLLVDAHLLFSDAILSFQNGAFMATAVMCRASVETALYLLMTRRALQFQGKHSVFIDYSHVHDGFDTLLREARSKKLVDRRPEDVFTRLRRIGNLAAHLGSIADKNMEGGLKWSVAESDAKSALRDAVSILNILSPKFPKTDTFITTTINEEAVDATPQKGHQ